MKKLARRIRDQKDDPPPVYVGSHEDKLSRLRPIRVDPDYDQPTREDRQGHESPFSIPVPLPRFLRPRRKRD